MSLKKTLMVVILMLVLTVVVNIMMIPYLPEKIASHWDERGLVNGYQSKDAFVWTMPVIMAITSMLMLFLPLIDPRKSNFLPMRNTYHFFVIGMMLFMGILQVYMILFNLGYKVNTIRWMIPMFAVLMVSIGFFIERAGMNWFVGIRTPWTLSSPVVWKKTHRLGGLLFKIGGALTLLGIFFYPVAFWFIIVPLLGISLFLVVYSFIIYRQEEKKTAG
jgi:uncharacterized membrane protein